MKRFNLPLSLVVGALFLGFLAAEIVGLRWQQGRAGRAVAVLEQKRQEGNRFGRLSPAPTPESESRLAMALAETRRTEAAMRKELASLAAEPAPVRSIDGFLDLARFEEAMRRRASAARVTLRPGEHFGFARYAQEGPALADLASTHRQRRGLEVVLDALWSARPQALLMVKRKAATAGAVRPVGVDPDHFDPPIPLPEHREGQVEADFFRLEFAGQTKALRDFVNALAAAQHPVIVRTVEVEPVAMGPVSPGPAAAVSVSPASPQASKFTVTVEIPLLPPAPEDAS